MKINLDVNQAQILLNFIDIGLKAQGLPAAQAALFFQKLLSDGIQSDTDLQSSSTAVSGPPPTN